MGIRIPSSPDGKALATYLASALHDLRKAYPCSVKVPQRQQSNERSHCEYQRLWAD
jgi:hypothetical protein